MNHKLKNSLLILEDAKNSFESKLYTGRTFFNERVKDEFWTLAEVVDHIIQAEKSTCSYIEYKLQQNQNLENTGITNWIKSKTLNILLKSKIKYKAPEVVSQVSNERNFDETMRYWNEEREKLKTLIDEFPKDKFKSQIFRHPVIGKINIFQTMDFLTNHLNHHVMQIEQIFAERNSD